MSLREARAIVLRAQQFGLRVDFGVYVGMKDDLCDAFAVTQMNENDPAQIAAAVDPSHQQRAGTRIFSA